MKNINENLDEYNKTQKGLITRTAFEMVNEKIRGELKQAELDFERSKNKGRAK